VNEPDAEALVSREELSATVAARRELGPEYEGALVDGLAERIEQVVRARVEANLTRPPAIAPATAIPPAGRIAIAVISLGVAIPITAVAGGEGGVAGIAIAWAGIAIVNVAAAVSSARGRR
jgi:hypothetical protein